MAPDSPCHPATRDATARPDSDTRLIDITGIKAILAARPTVVMAAPAPNKSIPIGPRTPSARIAAPPNLRSSGEDLPNFSTHSPTLSIPSVNALRSPDFSIEFERKSNFETSLSTEPENPCMKIFMRRSVAPIARSLIFFSLSV